jgi:hypothetical protein
MTNDLIQNATPTTAQRKEKLIREGASYRIAIRRSRNVISDNMHADVLARNVIHHLTGNASSTLSNLFKLNSSNVKTLLPILWKGASLLVKSRVIARPSLRTTMIVSAAGAGAFLWLRHRKAEASTVEVEPAMM